MENEEKLDEEEKDLEWSEDSEDTGVQKGTGSEETSQ